MSDDPSKLRSKPAFLGLIAVVAIASALVTALLVNVFERKIEAKRAHLRLDFIAAENSMGFHAPQEAARILGEAADYARQGQVAAVKWVVTAK